MNVRCPKCQVRLGVKPKHFGRVISCPKCQSKVKVPHQTPVDDVPVVQPNAPVVDPIAAAPPVAPVNDPLNDPFLDPLAPAPFAAQHLPSSTAPSLGKQTKRKNRKRGNKSSTNRKLWIGLGVGSIAILLLAFIAFQNISGFLEAFAPRTYRFLPGQEHAFEAKLTIPTTSVSSLSGNSYSANIVYQYDSSGKLNYTTTMKSFEHGGMGTSKFSPQPETGSFDFPSNGFGGFVRANETHRFPFLMGPAATAPIIPLGAGSSWTYQQELSLTIDQPMFGLQVGEVLNANWRSKYTVKFEQRNQTVIAEERTIMTPEGQTILTVNGEHTHDDRFGIVRSELRGKAVDMTQGLEIPFEFSVVKAN